MNRASHEVGRYLLEIGFDPNQRVGKVGGTLLHACAQQGDIGFAAILLEAGADPNLGNKYGKLPLEIAEQRRHQYLGDLLRKHEARVRTHAEIALGGRELTAEGVSRW